MEVDVKISKCVKEKGRRGSDAEEKGETEPERKEQRHEKERQVRN